MKDNRARLVEQSARSPLRQLEAIKKELPELEAILEKFGMDTAEYDRAMLDILGARYLGNTASTGNITTVTTPEEPSRAYTTTTQPHFGSHTGDILRYWYMRFRWWWRRIKRRVRELDRK